MMTTARAEHSPNESYVVLYTCWKATTHPSMSSPESRRRGGCLIHNSANHSIAELLEFFFRRDVVVVVFAVAVAVVFVFVVGRDRTSNFPTNVCQNACAAVLLAVPPICCRPRHCLRLRHAFVD